MRQMESPCRDDLERNIRLFVWFRVLFNVGFLLSRYINKSAPSECRASILSVNSLMINLGYGGVSLALGLAMNRASQSAGETAAFGDALEWLAIGLLLGLLIWFVASRPFRK